MANVIRQVRSVLGWREVLVFPSAVSAFIGLAMVSLPLALTVTGVTGLALGLSRRVWKWLA